MKYNTPLPGHFFLTKQKTIGLCYFVICITYLLQLSCRKHVEAVSVETKEEQIQAYRPTPVILHPELPGCPPDWQITPEQKIFWEYLETLNRLPDRPTEAAKKIFATKGLAPSFNYISTSETSLFGNIEGVMEHRVAFAQRYSWVQKLLDKYDITLEVDEKLFSGNATQVTRKYQNHVERQLHISNRPSYTKRWLECLLVVDYIYARGSTDDRKRGFLLMYHIFGVPALQYRRIKSLTELGHELEVPASYEIAMALMNDFPEDTLEQLATYPGMTFRHCLMPHLLVNYEKWMLRVNSFNKWQSSLQLCRVEAGNCCVDNNLLAYTAYWYHLHDNVRPENGWANVAVRELFKRIFGKQFKQEHQKYLKLLNAAYPEK